MPPVAATETSAAFFWPALERELAQWAEDGARATFWWRDDDATAASAALDRLLRISAGDSAPVAIAAIPKFLHLSLSAALKKHHTVHVLQHGFAHQNHAAGSDKKAWELGLHRPVDEIVDQLRVGRDILRAEFCEQFIPVVVPPWNRIDRCLLPDLHRSGFIGLSAFGQRAFNLAMPGFIEANMHFDLLSWKGGAQFQGQAAAERYIVGHLQRRRLGLAESDEPTGVLSHHLSLDDAAWRFLADLVHYVARHPSARWLSAGEIFEAPGQA